MNIIRLYNIAEAVENVLGVSVKNRNRTSKSVAAKAIFSSLARKHTGSTYEEIAQYCGRTHSTVIYGIKMCETQCAIDRRFKDIYDECEERFVDCESSWITMKCNKNYEI